MTLDDRLTRGFLAGVISGAAQSCISIPMYALKKSKLRWLDFASVLVFGDRPRHFSEAVAGELAMLTWSGLLGIGYTCAMPGLGERNFRFKGGLFGISAWFAIYVAIHLFQIPELQKIDKKTALVYLVAAVVWGSVLTETLHRMEQKTEDPSHQSSTSTRLPEVAVECPTEEGVYLQ